jgi:hypothetical protein
MAEALDSGERMIPARDPRANARVAPVDTERLERLMRRYVVDMLDRVDLVAPTPIFMILIAGALTKTGHAGWGMASIAGLCAASILAEVLDLGRRNQPAT